MLALFAVPRTLRFAPPGSRMSQETRLNLIAYILQVNGARAGGTPLTLDTDVKIGALIGR